MPRAPKLQTQAFIEHLEGAGRSSNTLSSYERDLGDFAAWLKKTRARDPFEPSTLSAYRTALRHRQLKPSTIRRRLMTIRSYLNWSSGGEPIPSSLSAILTTKLTRSRPQWLHAEDDKALIAAATHAIVRATEAGKKRGPRVAKRNLAILCLFLRAGLRLSEIQGLLRRHISLDTSRLELEDREIPLDCTTAEALEAWLLSAPPGKELFPGKKAGTPLGTRTIQSAVQSVAQAAQLGRKVHPRLLRHSAAARWAEAGLTLPRIARRLGVRPVALRGRLPQPAPDAMSITMLPSRDPLLRKARSAFEGFIGNQDTIELLVPELAEALELSPPVMGANIVFTGRASTGKTTLARKIASALGTPFLEISGGGIPSVEVLLELMAERVKLSLLPPESAPRSGEEREESRVVSLPPLCCFIDEVHELSLRAQNSMLTLLEPSGRRYERGSLTVDGAAVTFLFATTEFGKLTGPLRSRVDEYHLEPYSLEEVVEILRTHPEIPAFGDATIYRQLAIAGQLIPRQAIRRAQKLGTFARKYPSRGLLELLGHLYGRWKLDGRGLGVKHRRYLAELAKAGGPVGLQRLSDSLGIGQNEITQVIEPVLLHLELVRISGAGRQTY